jgi:hypothetical protein
MSNKYSHDIVATVGSYVDSSGQDKKRYQKVGAAFTDDEGRISLKVDAVPCSPQWSGWLSLYPKKQELQSPAPNTDPVRDGQDDIPF